MKKPARGLHHAFQHGIQAEVFRNGDDRFQQAGHPFLGLEQLLGPGHESLEDTVNHGLRLGSSLVRISPE
ncbi:hypothetical protein NicSoilB4_18640 [Arthrobacter sp. NicSoilB4]|nr:hypothetical protein NicSoilB4_18640 [Arthrobacter sp. NicSoilB4]